MPHDLDPNIPDLHELESQAAHVASLCVSWAVKKAPNAHLKFCAERLARHLLDASYTLGEMANDPEAPRHGATN
jgi:hypothetical protein